MKRILVTGATGNVGREVVHFLNKIDHDLRLLAGVRDIAKPRITLESFTRFELSTFDFDKPEAYHSYFEGIDLVFLLRPPHISDVEKVFKPMVQAMADAGVSDVVFLSVQGVEKSSIIPHHKIERLLRESNMNYVFLRPGYFMQNLTTTLLRDIRENDKIMLPAGNAVFNWIDVRNIGEVAARVILDIDAYRNKAFDITGSENLNFEQVANRLSTVARRPIQYDSANILRFFFAKKKEAMPTPFIVVMIMLHYLPRFQRAPQISNCYAEITGNSPTSLQAFLIRERASFTQP